MPRERFSASHGEGIRPYNRGDRAQKYKAHLRCIGSIAVGDRVVFLGEEKRVTRVTIEKGEITEIYLEGGARPVNILQITKAASPEK